MTKNIQQDVQTGFKTTLKEVDNFYLYNEWHGGFDCECGEGTINFIIPSPSIGMTHGECDACGKTKGVYANIEIEI